MNALVCLWILGVTLATMGALSSRSLREAGAYGLIWALLVGWAFVEYAGK